MVEDEQLDEFTTQLKESYARIECHPQQPAAGIRRKVARRRRRRQTIGGFATAGLIIAAVVQAWPGDDPPPRDFTVVADGTLSTRWSAETVDDWVLNADAAVVARVASEAPSGKFPAADGSGDVIIGRSVELSIDVVIWQRRGGRTAPSEFRTSAPGWIDRDGHHTPMAVRDEPRLEAGRRYVMALRDGLCRGERPQVWMPLGPGGTWPVTSNMIGSGESGGRDVARDLGQATIGSLEWTMIGRTPSDLQRVLEETEAASPSAPERTC